MLARGHDQGQRRPLVRWPRWARAWREDLAQHAAARAEARSHAPLRPGERLLAVARAAGGQLLAATESALYHQAGQAWARLGWEQVSRVGWDEQRHLMILTGLTPAVPARTVIRLAKDWGLPALAIERVSWATVVDQRVSLDGRAGARVIARRLPGDVGVTWLVVLDHGLDPGNLQVRAGLESALAELTAMTGLPDVASSATRSSPRTAARWP
jgi:hypothetical protein